MLDPGVLEVWEFLCQFSEILGIEEIPSISSLAVDLGVASPSSAHMQNNNGYNTHLSGGVILAFIDALMHEAYDAAIDIAAEASPDVKPRDLSAAFPALRVRSLCTVQLCRQGVDFMIVWHAVSMHCTVCQRSKVVKSCRWLFSLHLSVCMPQLSAYFYVAM